MTGAVGLGELFEPATRADPYPVFRRLREAAPLSAVDGELVVVADHERANAVLRDPAYSSDRQSSLMAQRAGQERRPVSFLGMDPPDHTRLRRLVTKAFTPKVIAALRPRITDIVRERLDAVRGDLDVVRDLAYPLPVQVISELLGIPPGDHGRFVDWSRRLVRGLDPLVAIDAPELLADIETAREELDGYLDELIAARRAEPGDDLLSALVRIEESGDVLSATELRATCFLLLVAGHETTVNLIANGALALLRNPEVRERLHANGAAAPAVVEETLRHDPPVQLTSRVATAGASFGGAELEPGGVVLVLIGAANRDPAAFADPDRFDIDRASNRAHLAFAAGPHYCLGASLARLEAEVALDAFARRVREPELGELSYRPHVTLRGPDRLRVRHADILRD